MFVQFWTAVQHSINFQLKINFESFKLRKQILFNLLEGQLSNSLRGRRFPISFAFAFSEILKDKRHYSDSPSCYYYYHYYHYLVFIELNSLNRRVTLQDIKYLYV